MKKIICLILLLLMLSSCSYENNDSKFDISKYINCLEEETNAIYEKLNTELDDVTYSDIVINYYDWESIWNIDFMADKKYSEEIYSVITIRMNDYIVDLKISYEISMQTYHSYYSFEIKCDNLTSIDEIKINNEDFYFIFNTLSEKLNVDIKLFYGIDDHFKKLNIIKEFNENKLVDEKRFFIKRELNFTCSNYKYFYEVYQNKNDQNYGYCFSMIGYYDNKTYNN